MRLEIENIGMISKAEIDLKKISVIAGENDTGKSTVGKVLYSIVYGINVSPKAYGDTIQNNVQSLIDIIKKKLYNSTPEITFEEFEKGTYFESERDKIDAIIKPLSGMLKSGIFLFLRSEETDTFKEIFKEYIETVENNLKMAGKIDFVKDDLEKLKDYGNFEIKDDFIEKAGIKSTLLLEFKEQIRSLFANKAGQIRFYQERNKVLDLYINKHNKFKWNSKLKKIYSKDVTYIESPFIFLKLNDGDEEKRILKKLRGVTEFCNHTDNLVEKLNSLKKHKYTKFFINEIENEILENIDSKKMLENCINGEIKYSEDDEDFVFIKNSKKIAIENVATGIKTLGLIGLVLKAGCLKDNNILILDEPEVHLHPKWQIKYAKSIVELARNLNIRILITSHSPYFIEAIEKYSRKFGLADETNFYLSQKSEDENSAVIENVNNNIEKIFNVLADAYDKLDEDIIGDL